MRKLILLWPLCLFAFCKKSPSSSIKSSSPAVPCQYNSNTTVSFSLSISPLLLHNCGSCHSSPGSGGINLDTYANVKSTALSGQLMPAVTNTVTSNIIMPPPPLQHLDSCQIKALNLWIAQGCMNN